MTAAPRIESELERRWQIRVEPSGVVHVLDTHDTGASIRALWADDGWPVFSTHEESTAFDLVKAIAKRTTDGDGWILNRPWQGSTRDVGELRYRLGLEYDGVLEQRGRE